MMTMLLEWVFTASFLILTVLLLRWVFGRRVSARLRYALWAVVLVRLLVPVQLFTSPLAGTWVLTETRTERIVQAPAAPTAPAGSAMGLPVTTGSVPAFPDAPSLPDAPEPPAAPDLTKAPVWLGWTWLGGSAALALVLAGSNLRFARRLRRGRIPVEDADCPLRVYAAAGLPSPCLFGLVRPAVYVTPEAAADPAMLRHVVAHEYTHFRHGDQIWSFLRCAALAAHWWNPLVWLAAALSRRDGELACDEGALRRLGDGERLAYGNTLLALVTAKPGPVDLLCFATTMAGDKKSLKERVSRIARAPKRWLWAAVAVVLVTALACVCAFGQKAEGRPAAGDSAKLPPADLSFTLAYSDDGTPFVRIEGQADGREVKHTVWYPEGDGFGFGSLVDIPDEGEKQGPQLSMRYEFPTGGAELAAKWADGEHTSVTLSTAMSASLSSIFNSGYWVFTVELSGDSGTVVFKEHSKGSSNPSAGKLTLYPEALPDEDAIQAARYAAKLLTAAEDWYKNCTAGEGHSEVPQVCTLDEYGSHMQLTYQGKVTDFYGFWDKGLQSDPAPQVLDLNGDGRDEIAFILVTGHGTGALDEQLYLFDAETLERYDTTDDLTGRLLQQIQSTGDGDYFYLSAPGMERVAISKEDVRGENPDVPLADALELGSHNEYSIEGGKLFCRLGCDASGRYTNYLGEVRVALELGRDGAVTASSFQYVPYGGAVSKAPQGLSKLPQTDLNRNGVPETLQVSGTSEKMLLEVREGGDPIFSEEAYHAHAGYNALFLCTLDGEDYLLRYNPYMAQGGCEYSYQLFTLSENGEEQVVKENSIEFFISYVVPVAYNDPFVNSFQPEKIAAFMDEINGLLANSVQLINSDTELLSTFEKEGRLYDSLWWLDLDFTRDPSKSLLENLRDYQAVMERGVEYRYWLTLMGKADFTLRQLFKDSENGAERSANIADVSALLDPDDPYMKLWSFAVVDLDGDGANEVLVYGCGVSGDRSGYLLLHQMNGRVYGLAIDHTAGAKQWFQNLKTDGTFEHRDDLGTNWMTITRLGFSPNTGYILDDLASAHSSNHEEYDSFEVNHQTAAKAEFEAVMAAQDAKPNAEWHDFTEENINIVFRS